MKKIFIYLSLLLTLKLSFGESVFLDKNKYYTGDIGKIKIENFDKNAVYELYIEDFKGNKEYIFPILYKTSFFGIDRRFKDRYAYIYLVKNEKIIFRKSVPIVKKKYRISRIWFKSKKRKVNKEKLKKILARIKRERIILRKTLRIYTYRLFREKYFRKPLKILRISTPFGALRILNGKRRYIHWGVDFRGRWGTPVYASLSGKVVLARNFYLTGNTVVINHGLGIYTLYAHLSKISVKEGQFVKAGRMIGRIGSTGRSTGPHLHFGIYINGVRVDPILAFRMRLD